MASVDDKMEQLAQATREHFGETGTAAKWTGSTLTEELRDPNVLSDEETEDGAKKIRAAQRRPMRCQVDGCGLDLTQARKYFQRYRVCERHLKSPSLQLDGHSVRFCDQCSKFHEISFFEGSRRTCNEKLERTRQVRSDKRRQRTEQAERAAMRASADWQSPCQLSGSRKRQFGEGISDKLEEKIMLESSTHAQPNRHWRLSLPATTVPSTISDSILASLPNCLTAQDVRATHQTALAPAMACGSGAVGGILVQLPDHGHGAGSCEGGCGGASSLSSWDNSTPHLQLLRMDSVSSRPWNIDGSHVHPIAKGAVGSDNTVTSNQIAPDTVTRFPPPRRGGEGSHMQRPDVQSAALPVEAQAAALLRELYAIVESGEAGAAVEAGNGGGQVAGRASGHAPRDSRRCTETLLVEALRGSSAVFIGNGQPGLQKVVRPYTDNLSARTCNVNGVMLCGTSGRSTPGAVDSSALPAPGRRLLAQMQVAEEQSVANRRLQTMLSDAFRHNESFAPSRVGAVQGGKELWMPRDGVYGNGNGLAIAGGDGEVDEAIAVALRALVASLGARHGSAGIQGHTSPAAATGVLGCREQEALSTAELILGALGGSRGQRGPTFCAGGGSGVLAATAPESNCLYRGDFYMPVMSGAAAERPMPVLDLSVDAHATDPGPTPQVVLLEGCKFTNAISLTADPSLQVLRPQQQPLSLQLQQPSEEYEKSKLTSHLLEAQLLQQLHHVQDGSGLRRQVQMLLELAGHGSQTAAAEATAAVAPQTPPQIHSTDVHHEFQSRAGEPIGNQYQVTYSKYFDFAASQIR